MRKMHCCTAILIGVMMLTGLLTTGCAYWDKRSAASSRAMTRIVKRETPAVYRDFGDVRIPKELRVEKKSTFVYQTTGFTGGVLSLRGRVETDSLVNFFDRHMIGDNWQLISRFKSPRTIMLFHKENKWCVISISEGDFFSTYVEIWIAPTAKNAQAGTPSDDDFFK